MRKEKQLQIFKKHNRQQQIQGNEAENSNLEIIHQLNYSDDERLELTEEEKQQLEEERKLIQIFTDPNLVKKV